MNPYKSEKKEELINYLLDITDLLPNVSSISIGFEHALILERGRKKVWGFGKNNCGQLGKDKKQTP